MSSVKRISKVVVSLLMLAAAVMLLIWPKDGYYVVVAIIDITFLLYGIRMLIYYFTMARYMVGGIMTLYKSIIVIDFGLFIFNLEDTPYKMVMLYLVGVMAFNGVVSILGGLDAKRLMAPSWRRRLVYGVTKLVLAACCLFLWDSPEMVTYIYCISLFQSAVYNIETAFKKSAIIHIG